MAKHKKSRTKYISKGERPNVSKTIRKLVRKHRNISADSVLQRATKIDQVLYRPQSVKEKALRDTYIKRAEVSLEAYKLFTKFQPCGITWAACIQAVKTDFVKQLQQKWYPLLKKLNKEKSRGNSQFASLQA